MISVDKMIQNFANVSIGVAVGAKSIACFWTYARGIFYERGRDSVSFFVFFVPFTVHQ